MNDPGEVGGTGMKKVVILIATGFGLGLSPVASGTAGALLGVAIVVIMPCLSWGWQAIIAAGMALVAVPICDAAEDHFGEKDDGRIVADEYLTFPICVIALPWRQAPWLLAVAFVVSRMLDIIKPPPARSAQVLIGGVGIVADDVISCLYALMINHAIYWSVIHLLHV